MDDRYLNTYISVVPHLFFDQGQGQWPVTKRLYFNQNFQQIRYNQTKNCNIHSKYNYNKYKNLIEHQVLSWK